MTGKFDFTLEFAPQLPGALPPPASVETLPTAEESGPNLISAVQLQLGLKLNPNKVAFDVLIIERADPIPTGNSLQSALSEARPSCTNVMNSLTNHL